MIGVVGVLAEAEQLLAHGHCRAAYARNAEGVKVHWTDPGAKTFCVLGAIRCALGLADYKACLASHSYDTVTKWLNQYLGFGGNWDISIWNDTHTTQDILQSLQGARLGLDAVEVERL